MAASYQELSNEQLVHKVLEVERDLVAAKFSHSMNELENTAHLRNLRKEIARLRTVARQREMSEGLPKDSLLSKYRKTFQSAGGAAPEAQAEEGGFLKGIVDKLTGNE